VRNRKYLNLNINFNTVNTKSISKMYAVTTILSITLLVSSCHAQNKALAPWYPTTNTNGDSVLAVYESRIPCPDCERMKFALVIYGNTQTGSPSTYTMSRIYVGKNNDRLTNSGKIVVKKGTSLDSTHDVYYLSTGAPQEFQIFWKVTKDILFILDDDLTPRVGDAGHGYVLNRIL
jgi:hypothetical protein